ncbi:MAG: hypothetical protein ABH844_02410 [Candidatus Omnitrophota bacterium]
MKPKKNFGARPKKTGARKRQKVLSQKRRLVASGQEKSKLDKMTTVEIRELLKKTAKRKRPSARERKPVNRAVKEKLNQV